MNRREFLSLIPAVGVVFVKWLQVGIEPEDFTVPSILTEHAEEEEDLGGYLVPDEIRDLLLASFETGAAEPDPSTYNWIVDLPDKFEAEGFISPIP